MLYPLSLARTWLRYRVYNDLTSKTFMMTSSDGSFFRVTGHLCVEFIGHRWIPRTKASDVELWFFYLRLNKRLSKQWWGWWSETPSRPLWRHCNVLRRTVSTGIRYSETLGAINGKTTLNPVTKIVPPAKTLKPMGLCNRIYTIPDPTGGSIILVSPYIQIIKIYFPLEVLSYSNSILLILFYIM